MFTPSISASGFPYSTPRFVGLGGRYREHAVTFDADTRLHTYYSGQHAGPAAASGLGEEITGPWEGCWTPSLTDLRSETDVAGEAQLTSRYPDARWPTALNDAGPTQWWATPRSVRR